MLARFDKIRNCINNYTETESAEYKDKLLREFTTLYNTLKPEDKEHIKNSLKEHKHGTDECNCSAHGGPFVGALLGYGYGLVAGISTGLLSKILDYLLEDIREKRDNPFPTFFDYFRDTVIPLAIVGALAGYYIHHYEYENPAELAKLRKKELLDLVSDNGNENKRATEFSFQKKMDVAN